MCGSRENGGFKSPLENHKFLYVFFRNCGTDPLEMQLDSLGPIASQQGSVRPSVKYVNDFLGSRLWCLTVSSSLSYWYPGSSVVPNCIDS